MGIKNAHPIKDTIRGKDFDRLDTPSNKKANFCALGKSLFNEQENLTFQNRAHMFTIFFAARTSNWAAEVNLVVFICI